MKACDRAEQRRGRPGGCAGPTGQTLWARLARSRHLVRFEREVLTTDDDDDLVLDHGAGPAGAPRLLILHGLEGSAHSLHTQGLAVQAARVGWRCTVLNFRSCARDPARISRRLPNRRPRLYHSGETGDLDFVVRTLVAREPSVPLYAVGFSLGGNVLLKWLGEAGAASAIRGGGDALGPLRSGGGLALPGTAGGALLHLPLPAAAQAEGARRAGAVSRARRRTSTPGASRRREPSPSSTRRSPRRCTGSPSADDYYARSSSLAYLSRITVPTLCISSEDDPFCPAESVARARAAASAVRHLRGHPLGRPHRLRLRPLALAAALLGRGAGRRLARADRGSCRPRRRLTGAAPLRLLQNCNVTVTYSTQYGQSPMANASTRGRCLDLVSAGALGLQHRPLAADAGQPTSARARCRGRSCAATAAGS